MKGGNPPNQPGRNLSANRAGAPPQHREVHLKKTTYFFNTVPFYESLFKKSVVFLIAKIG